MNTGAEDVDRASELIVGHGFPWCRARLFHALAAAYEQGILTEALDELLPGGQGRGDWDGYETGEMIAEAIGQRLEELGWKVDAEGAAEKCTAVLLDDGTGSKENRAAWYMANWDLETMARALVSYEDWLRSRPSKHFTKRKVG